MPSEFAQEAKVEREQERAVEELSALWATLFGGPPPVKASPATLAEMLIQHLPAAPSYGPDSRPPRF